MKDPVPDGELEPVLDDLFGRAEEYASAELLDYEVVRGDYGVNIYWGSNKADNVIALTAYNQEQAYVSAGVFRGREADLQPLGMAWFEDLEEMMDFAKGTAETL